MRLIIQNKGLSIFQKMCVQCDSKYAIWSDINSGWLSFKACILYLRIFLNFYQWLYDILCLTVRFWFLEIFDEDICLQLFYMVHSISGLGLILRTLIYTCSRINSISIGLSIFQKLFLNETNHTTFGLVLKYVNEAVAIIHN